MDAMARTFGGIWEKSTSPGTSAPLPMPYLVERRPDTTCTNPLNVSMEVDCSYDMNFVAAPVAAKVGVSTASSVETAVSSGTVASVATAVPAGAPAPEITGIRVDGANVFVTVRGTVPYLQYGLAEGKTPDAVSTAVDSAPQTGAAAADEEIVLVAPVKKGSSFFKVGRK